MNLMGGLHHECEKMDYHLLYFESIEELFYYENIVNVTIFLY